MKVFVYGTLKPGESNYPAYCGDRVTSAIQAYTWGQLYHLSRRGYPAMTAGNRKIRGFLLTFVDEFALATIDQLEDFAPQRSPEDNEYNRQKIPVFDFTDCWLAEAWGYVMSSERVQELGGILIPSGCWQQDYISFLQERENFTG
jgi:gamma-glutamylcyclotransferase (GGCT)/AIG2-like uncharacterized protein YtfP